MPKNKVNGLKEKRNELIRRISLCEEYKDGVVKFVRDLNYRYESRLISYEQYCEELNKGLEGRKAEEWIKYYDDSIGYYKQRLDKYDRSIGIEERRLQVIPIISAIIILALIGISIIVLKPTITGFTVSKEDIMYNDIDKLIEETGLNISKENIQDIKNIGFVGKEITFNNKEKKTLIIHKPILSDTFDKVAPLETKDDFTYTSILDGTKIEIEFDSEEIKRDKIGKKFKKDKANNLDSWKINYSLLLPSEDFKPKFRISSTSPIQIIDDYYGIIKTGEFKLDFKTERENNFDIEVNQIDSNIVYVYLSQKYSEYGKNINDEIDIDPTLTISNSVELCTEEAGYDLIEVLAGGVLQVCAENNTAGTGYVNISLGDNGNFTVMSGGIIEGQGRGGAGGAGELTAGTCSTQGDDGQTGTAGAASCNINNGGAGGATRATIGDSTGGGGGGFGGQGGDGGYSAAATKGGGGYEFGSAAGEILYMGSGGSGENGDAARAGVAGGAGIRVYAGGGEINIFGDINMTGDTGVGGDADDSGTGAGSGGHIILIAKTINLDNAIIKADGGAGGAGSGADSCGGGGGGGGRIVYVYNTISDTGLTNSTNGGATGTATDNACDDATDAGNSTAGWVGTVFYNQTSTGWPNLAPNNPSGLDFNSSISDQTNYTNESLTANFLCDDPDTSNTLTYDISFYVNGVVNSSIAGISCSDPEYVSYIFDDANTSKLENWSFSVNVTDTGGLNSSTVFSNNVTIVNYLPTPPTLNLPENNTQIEIDVLTIELNWTNVSEYDIDGENYNYYLEIWNSSDATNIMYVNASVAESANTTSDLVTFPSETKDYFWRVLANDGEANSSFTDVRNVSILVSVTNTAPNDPSGVIFNSSIAAQTNLTTEDLTANFLCDDPDTSDTLTYDISFYVNGVVNSSIAGISCSDPEYVSYIFDSANTSKGELWSFSVNVTDTGGLNSSTIFSNNVTIENSNPVIDYVSLNDSRTVLEGGIRQIEFSFIANDDDGTSDLNDAAAKGNVSKGTENSVNNTCANNGEVTGGRNYTCLVEIQYWYSPGSWNVDTEISDNSGISVQNSSQSFDLQQLIGMNVSLTSLTWPLVIPSSNNMTSDNDPVAMENTGNAATLNIFVQGIDLWEDVGLDNTTGVPAANFTVFNATTAANAECDDTNRTGAISYGQQPVVLVNDTDMPVVLNALTRGAGNIDNLYFCLFNAPSGIVSGTYSTGGAPDEEDWTISVQ